jgi:hypothetical protein
MRLPFRAVCALALCAAAPAIADEGMWLFNHPPVQQLKSRYNFDPSPAWLEHLQKSSVRFNSGGSGSFVSPDGLVMTNHHVGADCLAKMSTQERDLLKTGFLAVSNAEESKCPDLELNVLMSIEDVTARVNGAVKLDMNPATAQRARRATINTIEKESLDKTGLRSDVVTLYQGGQYHLYRYKKYTDVRLVFAPEKAAAFFGGDPDNFEYPRYDLDITFFRAYENNQPVHPAAYLKWSASGARDGELVFVSGHPGRTDRLNTVRDLEYTRDASSPLTMNMIRRREVMLQTYGARSAENARRAEDDLFGYQNSRKARLGMLAGLQDPALMTQKRVEEEKLRGAVVKSPDLQRQFGDAWDQVAAAIDALKPIAIENWLWERGGAFNSETFGIARTLLRMAEESRKPNAERLREYSEAGLESLRQQLFSDAPIYEDLETVKLTDSLSMMLELLGGDNPLAVQVMAGKSPAERASELVRGTRLRDVAVRKQLAQGGLAAIEASNDPMIQLARLIDAPARKLRAAYEEKVDEPRRQAYGKIARARFAVYGNNVYPDATFTLRLAFGEVKGYQEDGKAVPAMTSLGGTYVRASDHHNKEPFELPQRWIDRKSRLNLATPFNFVSTADIIGGNSGSPVVNRAGELVGIIFDGNIQSLVLDYTYTDTQARAVAVHSAGIIETLEKIYDAGKLVGELTGQRR